MARNRIDHVLRSHDNPRAVQTALNVLQRGRHRLTRIFRGLGSVLRRVELGLGAELTNVRLNGECLIRGCRQPCRHRRPGGTPPSADEVELGVIYRSAGAASRHRFARADVSKAGRPRRHLINRPLVLAGVWGRSSARRRIRFPVRRPSPLNFASTASLYSQTDTLPLPPLPSVYVLAALCTSIWHSGKKSPQDSECFTFITARIGSLARSVRSGPTPAATDLLSGTAVHHGR